MGLLSTFRLDRDWQAQAQVVPVGGGGVVICATSLAVVGCGTVGRIITTSLGVWESVLRAWWARQ